MPSRLASPVRRTRGPASLVGALYDRFEHLIHEVGKFGVVGATCYVIDVAVYGLCLLRFHTGWLPALVISTVISTSCAFTGNRFWTWRDRERTSLRREYGLYFGFNLVGLGIGAACLVLSHEMLGSGWPAFQTPLADIIAGKIIGVGLASLFRFWAYRRFIFRPAVSPV